MIKIPDKITIGGIDFEVKWVKELNNQNVALLQLREGAIEILDDLGEEVAFSSFIHEIFHSVLYTQNIWVDDWVKHDERFVETSAQLLSQIIKQIMDYNYDTAYIDGLLGPEKEKEEKKTVLNIEGFD